MTTVTMKQARDNFSELISRVAYGGETILVTKHGKIQVSISKPKATTIKKTTETKTKDTSQIDHKLAKFAGIWSHRDDIEDVVEWSTQLREKVMSRT